MIMKGAETLPAKDAQTFKQLAKLHDAKNYKKGLKNTEKLLESHPDHPETLALKALFEIGVGNSSKALESAKVALMKSKMSSAFCWQTIGLVYKHKKDYFQAARCFSTLVTIQKDNIQLLRETAALLIQIRDHQGHISKRYQILKLKSNQIQNWAAFTVAYHLKGDFPAALKSLQSFDNLIKTLDLKAIETSHYLLYRVVLFRDAEKYEEMRTELIKNKAKIKDQVLWSQLFFQSAQRLQLKEEAETTIRELLYKFPENTKYIRKYRKLSSLTDRQFYKMLIEDFKSKISKIYSLTCNQDQVSFKEELRSFIIHYFQKNLISLFSELLLVYESGKASWIGEVLIEFEQSLSQPHSKYPNGIEAVSPSEYLWSLYLLAQHHSRTFQTLPLALEFIDKAIKHTNTVSEFYMIKADILYRMHNNYEAVQVINQARKTDLADRYMNNICVKMLMKCQKPQVAEEVLRLFMKDDASLYEMQNQWYIIGAGKSFLRQRNFAVGLKHMNFIQKQFQDMLGNELDFHSYCVRRWTLREYTQLIRFNDNIYADKKYLTAATWALQYLPQYQHWLRNHEAEKLEESTAKGQQQISKKKKKKKKEEQPVKLTPIEEYRKKIDFYGDEYTESIKKNPMEEALTYAKNVANAKFVNKGETHENKIYGKAYAAAINVFIYFKKPLLVLKCVKKLIKTNFSPGKIHSVTLRAINFFHKYIADDAKHPLITQFLQEWLDSTLGKQSITEYHSAQQRISQTFFERQQNSLYLNSYEVPREQLIQFYKDQFDKTLAIQEENNLSQVFNIVHKLEFYGQFTPQMRALCQQKYGQKTTYFSNWRKAIDQLPESTWTMWWLSAYDIEREELDLKETKDSVKDTVNTVVKEESDISKQTVNSSKLAVALDAVDIDKKNVNASKGEADILTEGQGAKQNDN